MDTNPLPAAYGGPGWQPRLTSTQEELGTLWARCGVASEYGRLRQVLLHRPGPELQIPDPNRVNMLAPIDLARAQAQHDALIRAYEEAGVRVHLVDPPQTPPPNLLFVADLLFMTPEGAILARPASRVRAGEERWVARRLAALGIPILCSVHGLGVFEGADAMWITPDHVLVAEGLRTNAQGRAQVAHTLAEMGVEVIPVGLPFGTMHLMGVLRLLDRDLAIAWPGRVPYAAIRALQAHGIQVHLLPDETEARRGHALNVVPLAPRTILMPAGNPITQRFYESLGVTCLPVEVDEILKAAGGIGCMTGVLERER